MKIPLNDLSLQHAVVADEIRAGFDSVMERSAYILGAEVEDFEHAFASYCGVEHCVGVGNGTDAVELALRAVGVEAGDEVVVPAFTFVATALGASRIGARPVFVDVDAVDHQIDVEAVAAAIGERTRAVVGVDLFGRLADWEALESLCRERGVVLVEDAAQAQGARRPEDGRAAGSFGAVAAMSFYPGKNIGAYGDAGCVLSADAEIAERVRCLRSYGSENRYEHPELGFNSRLDTLQAVVLKAKLPHLEAWNRARRSAAQRYEALFADCEEVRCPRPPVAEEHVWHVYVARLPRRDHVLSVLHGRGIGAGVHYPTPLHRLGAFEALGYAEGSFPHSEAAALEVISLPLFPGIREDQQQTVVDAVKDALAGARS